MPKENSAFIEQIVEYLNIYELLWRTDNLILGVFGGTLNIYSGGAVGRKTEFLGILPFRTAEIPSMQTPLLGELKRETPYNPPEINV